MVKNIVLEKPWTLNIEDKFKKKLSTCNNSVENLLALYKKFGYDLVPYDGVKRWGDDSSTETSDITYDEIEEGTELWWKRYTENSIRWTLIRITHKYGGILFFETLNEKKNRKSYIDTGGDDYVWEDNDASRYTLPKHKFYPVKIIKPKWIDISEWHAPKMIQINKDL